MLSLRDPSPRLLQGPQSICTRSGSPQCKDEPCTPHIPLRDPIQDSLKSLPVPDTAVAKTEVDTTQFTKFTNTMERRNEAGPSGTGSNNNPRRPNPQQEAADAELARLLQLELARTAGASAPESASPPLPLTLQGFGIPPPQQRGPPEHAFPAPPFPSMAGWSAYDPQAHAQLEQFLRQTNAPLPPEPHDAHAHAHTHAHGGSLDANQQNPFFPSPSATSPLSQLGYRSSTAKRTSQTSSAPSGNDSPTADPASSQGVQRPRTQAEIDAAMIAEEKRRRNTAASARFRTKKKQKMVNLERSLSDLQRRADDLEREATELRRENTWLKEMVLMKGRRGTGNPRRALVPLEETPPAASSNRGKGKGKGSGKRAVVEEEDEEGDYLSESEEEESEDESEDEDAA